MSWKISINVENTTNKPVQFKIPKGHIFENKYIGTGKQNVAAIKDYSFTLPAQSKSTFTVEVLCINQKLSPPHGSYNLTKYKISKNFHSQQSLWAIMNP